MLFNNKILNSISVSCCMKVPYLGSWKNFKKIQERRKIWLNSEWSCSERIYLSLDKILLNLRKHHSRIRLFRLTKTKRVVKGETKGRFSAFLREFCWNSIQIDSVVCRTSFSHTSYAGREETSRNCPSLHIAEKSFVSSCSNWSKNVVEWEFQFSHQCLATGWTQWNWFNRQKTEENESATQKKWKSLAVNWKRNFFATPHYPVSVHSDDFALCSIICLLISFFFFFW